MSDHQDRLGQLNDFDPGVPVSPLPASEVRRRGDRRRRRTATLSVAAAAAVIAVIVTPVAVLAGHDRRSAPAPANPPSTAVTDTSGAPLGAGDVLALTDLPSLPDVAPWTTDEQDTGPSLACQPRGAADRLGATAELSASYTAYADVKPRPAVPTAHVRTTVLEFASEDDAATAATTATGWVTACSQPHSATPGQMSADGSVRTVHTGDTDAVWQEWSYPAPDVCTGCDAGHFDRMGVARAGDRVVLVSLSRVGGPLAPPGLDAIGGLLVTAQAKAAPGSADSPIPSGFPLDQGLVVGDGGEKLGPSADVKPITFPAGFCGAGLWPAAGTTGRLAVSVSGPTYLTTRELVVLATTDQAAQLVDDLRTAVQQCEGTSATQQDPVAYQVLTATTGHDSVGFGYTYYEGPGGTVYQFVQVGNAVVAQASTDQRGGSNLQRGVDEITTQLQPVLGSMCLFDGSC